MKKKYTKKQIQEAINYWTKQLKTMNESIVTTKYYSGAGPGSNPEKQELLDNPDSVTLHGYDRIKNKIGEHFLSADVVNFFRQLDNKMRINDDIVWADVKSGINTVIFYTLDQIYSTKDKSIVELFNYLAKKANSTNLSLLCMIDDNYAEPVNITYASSDSKLDEILQDAGENG